MEWISVENEYPSSPWHVVFITDGEITFLARWIENPKEWYGDDLFYWDEENKKYIPLDKEWHSPHWILESDGFIGNDEVLLPDLNTITHWMHLPLPPKE
ncbi:MAG: hypothetical protein ACYC0F_18565 [Rhodanobacter sp.]